MKSSRANGVVKCSVVKCSYNADGRCCQFASANEQDKKNTLCQGKIPNTKSEPLHIGFFRTDFSDVSTERLKEFDSMFKELSYCVDVNSPNVTDVWKVMTRFSSLVHSELVERGAKQREAEKQRQKRRKKGLPTTKKTVIKPLKAKKL